MADERAVVAIYGSDAQAAAAVQALAAAGVTMAHVSVAGRGRDGEQRSSGLYTSGGAVKHHGSHGGLWTALSNLLLDTGTFFIPGTGPIFVAGPVVGWLAGEVEGERLEGDPGPVGAALASAGIPEDERRIYEGALREGQVLVIVHGPDAEAAKAKAALEAAGGGTVITHEA
ncbi:MAG TPA: general stress protein [Dehalococcoidia bacterium]|nr:general stress protein [Dehalococcoidia bacterium]